MLAISVNSGHDFAQHVLTCVEFCIPCINKMGLTDFLIFCSHASALNPYFECMNAQNAFRLRSVRSVLSAVQN